MATRGRASTTTVLFTDLVGSTEILQRLGDDEADALRRVHFRLLRQSIAAHGGHEVKNIGDSLMVVFSSAFDAVASAVAVQQAVHQHNEQQGEAQRLHVRVGLNAGEPVRDEEDYFGMPVVIARRLCDGAKGGQIVASALVRGLVGSRGGFAFRELGRQTIKGIAEPVSACEVLWEPLADEQTSPAPIVEERPEPLPSGRETRGRRPPITGQAPFTGRRAECEALDGWLAEVAAGHPRLVLLAGDAGIGKSRLLREWRASNLGEARGASGRAFEDISIPYLPFIEMVNSLLAESPGCLDLVDEDGRDDILSLLGKKAADSGPEAQSGDANQRRLALVISRLISTLAESKPLVLAMEDLHWADRPSVSILVHLVIALQARSDERRTPVMIVATYRPGEIDSHAGRILARLRREDCCAELELPGLSESETTELITGLGYRRPSHQLVATVFEATRGSPLFVGEAMHHLTASGSLIERGGYLATERPASDLKLPAEVTEAIEQRLASVEGDARTVLNLAACLGDWFSWRALQLSSGLEEEACLAALSQCVEGGLIEADGASFRFAHPLVRRVAHRSIIAPRRERLHKAIAEALAEVYADSFDEHIAEIANHLLAAGTQADAESVVEHAKRAADTALSVFAWRDAARYYEGAIQAAERSRQFSPRDVAELHAIAGYAWYRDMDPGPSLEHYGQAIEGFGRTGDSRGLVQALTERARLQLTLASIPYGTLLDLNPIQEAISQLRGEDSDVQAKALALMSTAYWHARMPEESERVAGEAFALARASGDEVTAVHALNNRGMARLSSLDLEGALADFETSLEIARPLGDPWLLGWPLPRICPVLITLGRLDEVEAYVEEACRVTTQTGDWGDLSVALAYRIVHCYFLGDFDGVERHALEGLQAARRSRYPWGAAVFLPTLASARTMWGAADEAQDAIQALIEPGSIIDDPGVTLNAVGRIFGTLVSAAAGDEEPGRARLPRMLGAARAAGRRDIQSLASYCALAEIAAYLGDAAAAEEQYEPLLFARDRGAVLCSSWGFLIPRVLGLISSVNGRWEEAERHFADALETARRTGVRPELGRTLLDYATMLNTRRSREDQQGAAKMLEQAAAIFGEFAMTPFVERAAALAAKVGATPPAATRAESARYPDNLSGREVEVLLLLTRGYTNNRIAEELVLSVKTVARHMSNIFVKISVDSRSAATAYAFERGLVERSGQGRRLP